MCVSVFDSDQQYPTDKCRAISSKRLVTLLIIIIIFCSVVHCKWFTQFDYIILAHVAAIAQKSNCMLLLLLAAIANAYTRA